MRHYKIDAAAKTPNLPGIAPTKEVRVRLSEDDEVAGYGMPIMPSTFHLLFRAYYDKLKQTQDPDIYKTVAAVELGRESFMRILAQKGCEGIRVVFGEYTTETGERRNTIIAMGLDANGRILDEKKINPDGVNDPGFDLSRLDDSEIPVLEEVGHGITLGELITRGGIEESDYRNLIFF